MTGEFAVVDGDPVVRDAELGLNPMAGAAVSAAAAACDLAEATGFEGLSGAPVDI